MSWNYYCKSHFYINIRYIRQTFVRKCVHCLHLSCVVALRFTSFKNKRKRNIKQIKSGYSEQFESIWVLLTWQTTFQQDWQKNISTFWHQTLQCCVATAVHKIKRNHQNTAKAIKMNVITSPNKKFCHCNLHFDIFPLYSD